MSFWDKEKSGLFAVPLATVFVTSGQLEAKFRIEHSQPESSTKPPILLSFISLVSFISLWSSGRYNPLSVVLALDHHFFVESADIGEMMWSMFLVRMVEKRALGFRTGRFGRSGIVSFGKDQEQLQNPQNSFL